MKGLLNNRQRLGIVMATLFVIGMAFSIYQVYRISNDPVLSPDSPAIYIILGFTFLVGFGAIWITLFNKEQLIVFKEKQPKISPALKKDPTEIQQEISLQTLQECLQSLFPGDDPLRAGLKVICSQLQAGLGSCYKLKDNNGHPRLEFNGGYALPSEFSPPSAFDLGEGLTGQAAADGKSRYIDEVPADYNLITSGLGNAVPRYLVIIPVRQNEQTLGVLEMAFFKNLAAHERKYIETSVDLIAKKLKESKELLRVGVHEN